MRRAIYIHLHILSGSGDNLEHDLGGGHLNPYLRSGGGGVGADGSGGDNNKLGLSDYIAIGVCVGFLGLVYVVAISIFLMLKRKRKRKERIRQQFLLPPSTMPPGLG